MTLLGDHGRYQLGMARWGLIPHWSMEISKRRPINARAESLVVKPFFRHILNRRHCIIPASGFYESKPAGKRLKEPWYIHRKDNCPMGLAGLWNEWQPPGPPSLPMLSCTIITTGANREMKPVHDHMPVIIEEEEWAGWLDSSNRDALQLFDAADEKVLDLYPVSTRVNNPRNDSRECIERIENTG